MITKNFFKKMNLCRLKIITANINPDPQTSDTEIIKYLSKSKNDNNNEITENEKENNGLIEEEKNNEMQNEENEEEEIVIIRDKDDLIKSNKNKSKISKEKIYLIDGLFSSTNMTSQNQNKKSTSKNKYKSNKSNTNNLIMNSFNNILKNKNKNQKKNYSYKLEYNYDNKVNTFYNSKNKNNNQNAAKNDENPFAFNYYKANKEINSNISGLYDYKGKIKDLLKEEPKIIENRENILKENKNKISDLLKENTKLNYELGFEINREDELKGEIIILNNKNKILINELNNIEKKIKEYQDIIKHKSYHEKIITNKQNEIMNYYNNLNQCLSNGDILLVTKPDINNNYFGIIYNNNEVKNEKINEDSNKIKVNIELENQNIELELTQKKDDNEGINNFLKNDIINLLLKGYFINMNITNVDDAVNKIWNKKKPIQLFETLVEELLIIINNYINNNNATFINEYNRNILMNYFYSFCNCYNYITINEFKSIFHDKLGNFLVSDNNFMEKLYKFCNTKLSDFIQIMKDLDINQTGKIKMHEFFNKLKEKNYHNNIVEQNELNNLIQLLIIYMKKNPSNNNNDIDNKEINTQLNSYRNRNIDNNTNTKKEIINKDIIVKEELSIYDLYYEPLIKLIYENNKSENPLYKAIIKKYLIENGFKSLQNFLEPLLLKSDVIINKGLDRYIKAQTFSDFLDNNNVIDKSEKFLLPYEDDDLLDINIISDDIDKANPLAIDNNFEENKEHILNNIINSINDN